MSYAGMLRNTLSEYPGSESEASGVSSTRRGARAPQDGLYLKLNEIDSQNARIKKQILRFGELNP